MLGDLYTQLNRVGRLDVLEAVAAKAAAYFAALSPADLNDATQLARAKAQRLLGGVRMSQARYADADTAYSGAYAAGVVRPRGPPTRKDLRDALSSAAKAEYGIGYQPGWMLANYAEAGGLASPATANPGPPSRRSTRRGPNGSSSLPTATTTSRCCTRAAASSPWPAPDSSPSSPSWSGWPRPIPPTSISSRARRMPTRWLAGIAERQGDLPEAMRQYSTQVIQLDYAARVDPRTPGRRGYEALALLYQAGIDMVIGQYAASGEMIHRARGLLDPLVAHDAANIDWKSSALIASLSEAELRRHRGEAAAAARLVDDALPQLEALWANEPSDHIHGRMLMMAWKLRTQLQLAAGQPEAAASAVHTAAIAGSLSQAKNLTDAEIGECAQAYVVCGEVAAKSGDAVEAPRDWTRAAEMLAPRIAASRDWRLLDPQARAAAWPGRAAQAQAAIETLHHIGYAPIDPWPGPVPPAATPSDPQPK